MKGKTAGKIIALFAVAGMLAGCGGKTGTTPDDYATNDGYITTETAGNSTGGAQSDTTSGTAGISKENIKVGVLYISDPDEGERSWMTLTQRRRRKQSKHVFRMGAILFLQPAGGIWKQQQRWLKNIRIFTFPMEPVICQMERTSTIILVVFTR